MEFAIWAYPWDLLDEGLDSAIDRLVAAGINEINLATTYHSVHSFSPTNPDRRSYFARASAYFQPSGTYGNLEPVSAEQMGEADWVAKITDRIADSPLSCNAWTVGCHNSRLGLRNPDLTIESPDGDSLSFGLCPSQPAVQSYLTTLVGELDDRPFDRIELETFDYFFGSGLGWHHDKVFVELGRLGTFLLGLCFCDACRANAADDGVDVTVVRNTAIETIDAVAAGDLPATLEPLEWLRAHPEVDDYVAVRERTLVDLYAQLRETVDAELGYYVGMLDVGEEWLFGADLPALAEHLDYVTAIAYEPSGRAAADRINTADDLTPGIPVHAGLQPGPPVVDDEASVRDLVDSAVEAGAPRLSFYNDGPLPERSLEWIAAAIDPYR